MQEILASVKNNHFDIEFAIEQQLGALSLPFPRMDKSGAALCRLYSQSICSLGDFCPFRHLDSEKTIVCKHWLRGLCKKGDQCEFLHQYDQTKMPECHFYAQYNECRNKDCLFQHINRESKIKNCPWYDRGFCKHGQNCKFRHLRKVLCQDYNLGICMNGKDCEFEHPSFDIPITNSKQQQQAKNKEFICNFCGETGHTVKFCFKIKSAENRQNSQSQLSTANKQTQIQKQYRSLDQVTCYKCDGIGHYANKCPKGYLAFLSRSLK